MKHREPLVPVEAMEYAYKEHLLTHGCCLQDEVCADAQKIFDQLWRPTQKRREQLSFEAASGGLVARVTATTDNQWKWWIETRHTRTQQRLDAKVPEFSPTKFYKLAIYTPTPGGKSEPALGQAPDLFDAQKAAGAAMHTASA